MKKFQELHEQNKIKLPTWYDKTIHITVVHILTQEGKLHACKFLRDISKELKSTDENSEELDLITAKSICDFIKPQNQPTDRVWKEVANKLYEALYEINKMAADASNVPDGRLNIGHVAKISNDAINFAQNSTYHPLINFLSAKKE